VKYTIYLWRDNWWGGESARVGVALCCGFGFGCSVSTFGLSFSHFRLVDDRACEGFLVLPNVI